MLSAAKEKVLPSIADPFCVIEPVMLIELGRVPVSFQAIIVLLDTKSYPKYSAVKKSVSSPGGTCGCEQEDPLLILGRCPLACSHKSQRWEIA